MVLGRTGAADEGLISGFLPRMERWVWSTSPEFASLQVLVTLRRKYLKHALHNLLRYDRCANNDRAFWRRKSDQGLEVVRGFTTLRFEKAPSSAT